MSALSPTGSGVPFPAAVDVAVSADGQWADLVPGAGARPSAKARIMFSCT